MIARPKRGEYYKITISSSDDSKQVIYVDPSVMTATMAPETQALLLQEIGTALAKKGAGACYVDRITKRNNQRLINFLPFSAQQFQEKSFDTTKPIEKNITISSEALSQERLNVIASARKNKSKLNQITLAPLEEKHPTPQATAQPVRENKPAKAAKREHEDPAEKEKANIEAGRKLFPSTKARVEETSKKNSIVRNSLLDQHRELQKAARQFINLIHDPVRLTKIQGDEFSRRIAGKHNETLIKFQEKRKITQEKIKVYQAKIDQTEKEADKAIKEAYSLYDTSSATQSRRILINSLQTAIQKFKYTDEEIAIIAQAIKIKNPQILRDPGKLNDALKNKNAEEMTVLIANMNSNLQNTFGKKEKFKGFILLLGLEFGKALTTEKDNPESSPKENATHHLHDKLTAIENQLTTMQKEIQEEISSYKDAVKKHAEFIEKEKHDFLAIKELLAQAEDSEDTGFDPLQSSIAELGKKAQACQEKIIQEEKAFELPASTVKPISVITEANEKMAIQRASFNSKKNELIKTLSDPTITLENAQKAVQGATQHQENCLNRAKALVDKTKQDLITLEEQHTHAASTMTQEKRNALYTVLANALVNNIEYWKTQSIRGTTVLDSKGHKTTVPTGIGEMIILMDARHKPLSPAGVKDRFFGKAAEAIPALALGKNITPEDLESLLTKLKEIAESRLTAKDFRGNRGEDYLGRRDPTIKLYEFLSSITIESLNNPTTMKSHIQAIQKLPSWKQPAESKVHQKPAKPPENNALNPFNDPQWKASYKENKEAQEQESNKHSKRKGNNPF